MGIIYRATNTVNGKIYIGQTIRTLNKRIINHYSKAKCGSDSHFHAAIRKYDKCVWEWDTLIECLDDELNEQEMYYVELYNTYYHGYNSTKGGNSGSGYKHSDEAKLRISIHNSGKTLTEEHRNNISKTTKGRPALNRKLNKEQIDEINELFNHMSNRDIANIYSVSISTIYRIRIGKHYRE